MVREDDLEGELSMFEVKLDDNCKTKMIELCHLYQKDASDIVSEWVAFSASKSNVAMSMETLDIFEAQRLNKAIKRGGKTPKTPQNFQTKSRVYTPESIADAMEAEDLLTSYATPADKKNVKKRQLTPDNPILNKRFTSIDRSPAVRHSPSFSPASATPSQKYSTRNNSGDVVCSYGSPNTSYKSTAGQTVTIQPYDTDNTLGHQFKYMFQKLVNKAHILNDHIEDMACLIKQHHNIEDFSSLTLPAQDNVAIVGRICCDSDGRLNAKSVLLEGSRETSSGRDIRVDLSHVSSYSLFPGQVVGMEGINSTGKTFVANKIYDAVPYSLPDTSEVNINGGALNVMIAAGPFTTSDSFSFEPLADLVKQIHINKPHVCILIGPFIDSLHDEVQKLDVEYEEFFNTKILNELLISTSGLQTELVLIPSQRDIHHEYVYPQPPFTCYKEQQDSRLHFFSDPCTLSINGVVFGITSSDVIKHLSGEEIYSNPSIPDRMTRLSSHLLSQQSYYPLCPAVRGLNMDYEYYDVFCRLPVTPNVLVVPSELRYFIKENSGCLYINPSSLAKGHIGGTFAQVVIQPGQGSEQESVLGQTSVKVVRI